MRRDADYPRERFSKLSQIMRKREQGRWTAFREVPSVIEANFISVESHLIASAVLYWLAFGGENASSLLLIRRTIG